MTIDRSVASTRAGAVRWLVLAGAITWCIATPAPASGQERDQTEVIAGPVKVSIVLSRVAEGKVKSSLPFMLHLNPESSTARSTSLRMGTNVPIPSGKDGSYTYQNIGTNIDCIANPAPDGRIRLTLTISDSSITSPAPPGVVQMSPMIQQFTSSNVMTLRDGQTLEYTTATDKATGEVVRVSVTINVLK